MSRLDRTKSTESRSIQLHEAVEKDLDANYQGVSIAHPSRTIAMWYLLTVLEDSFRALLHAEERRSGPDRRVPVG